MQNHTWAFTWIRSHRRLVAIVVALALAFTIIAALVTPGFDSDSEFSAEGGESMIVAGLSWSRMMVWSEPAGGPKTNGLSWSNY